jgi:hypothetical protein
MVSARSGIHDTAPLSCLRPRLIVPIGVDCDMVSCHLDDLRHIPDGRLEVISVSFEFQSTRPIQDTIHPGLLDCDPDPQALFRFGDNYLDQIRCLTNFDCP